MQKFFSHYKRCEVRKDKQQASDVVADKPLK